MGDRDSAIKDALVKLAETEAIEVIRTSDVIETPSLGDKDQPAYLNCVAQISTSLSAEDLYKKMADIENTLGRVRTEKWSPRIIDLDLLLFGTEVITSKNLTVPHSQMHLRSFVLEGLCQLDGQLVHPLVGTTVAELAGRLNGADFMLDSNRPQLISIAGVIGVGKTTLAAKLSELLGCKLLLEAYDTNPFLPQVYAGRKEMALDSQLYFLTHRAEQLDHSVLVSGKMAITDYIFDKELIYARQLLDEQQLKLYNKIYPWFSEIAALPVLVIYLIDSPQNCLRRIQKRNRPYERAVDETFLEILRAGYEQLLSGWRYCPVIRIKVSDFDLTDDSNIRYLSKQIRAYVT